MKNIVLRPLALFCMVFFVSLCVCTSLSESVKIAIAASFAALFAAFALFSFSKRNTENRKKHRTAIALCFLAAALSLSAVLSLNYERENKRICKNICGETYETDFTVTKVIWDGGYSGMYIAQTDTVDGKKESVGIILTSEGGLTVGSRLTAPLAYSEIPAEETESTLRYYKASGVIACAESESAPVSASQSARSLIIALKIPAAKLNTWLSGIFTSSLGSENGGFAAALLLGNRTLLSDTVSRNFSRLGISHLLALSGLHLSVICALAGALLRPAGRKARYGAMIAVVVFYMFLTGFSPSVTRAGIMLIVSLTLRMTRLCPDSYTSLGIAVLLMSVVDPASAYDIGLQLSFAATFAVIMYSHSVAESEKKHPDKRKSPVKKLALAVGMTAVVVLFLLPLSCLYFGETSILAPLTSVAYSLAVTLLLWLLPFVLFFAPAPTFTAAISFVTGKIITFVLYSTEKLALLPHICVSLSYPFAPAFCVALTILISMLCLVRKKKKKIITSALIAAAIAAFALSALVYTQQKPVTVTPVSSGKSDCAVVTSPLGTVLVDSSDGYTRALRLGAESALYDSCKTEIDTVIITHLHNRYVTTLPSLFDKYIVRELIIPDDPESTDAANAVKSLARRYKVSVAYFTPGETLTRVGTEIKTYPYAYISRSTQPVIRYDVTDVKSEKSLAYLGSAYSEVCPGEQIAAENVWLGSHGPKYQEEIDTYLEDKTVFASEAAASCLPEGITSADTDSPVELKP